MARPRLNNWWVPGEGIARVVIQADIQRYLGPDALVKPGENEGRQGFWITAYRTLTSEMIQDLKLDTQRWEREQEQIGRRGSPLVREGKSSRHPDFSVGQQQDQLAAYRDSTIHQSRQYYGPTAGDDGYSSQPPQAVPSRYDQSPNYTHQSTPQGYGAVQQSPTQYSTQPGYSAHTQPRSHPGVTQYNTAYGQPTSRSDHQGYSIQPQAHGYSQQQSYSSYGSTTQQAPPPPTQSRTARPGWYFASDGKEYPIPAGGIPRARQ